jgi:hypothetical protein
MEADFLHRGAYELTDLLLEDFKTQWAYRSKGGFVPVLS